MCPSLDIPLLSVVHFNVDWNFSKYLNWLTANIWNCVSNTSGYLSRHIQASLIFYLQTIFANFNKVHAANTLLWNIFFIYFQFFPHSIWLIQLTILWFVCIAGISYEYSRALFVFYVFFNVSSMLYVLSPVWY